MQYAFNRYHCNALSFAIKLLMELKTTFCSWLAFVKSLVLIMLIMLSTILPLITVPASLAGIPGLTIPVGYASPKDDATIDLPVGLQILGPVLGEEKCLMVGHVLENAMKEKIQAKQPRVF